MKKIMKKVSAVIGVFVFCFGICCGDSECLLIPCIIIAVGVTLMKIGGVFHDNYREYDR